MSDDRAQFVKNLFHAAGELDMAERGKFLDERCAEDAALRAEVERLLSAEALVPEGFLEGAGPSTGVTMPTHIGHFRILRRIGDGGMGTVFEAEQDNPRRKVALKIIRSSVASESVLRRFEHEVQILGQLKHPGIAQIYEAGTHDEGTGAVPYFAMEYVQGRSLSEFVQQTHPTVRAKLSLMSEISDAVHHAHQKGVIHRDLKPANIIVEDTPPTSVSGEGSSGGRPRILDFGVARAIHSDIQLVTMHTEVGQIVGTLSYMSPEQVAGRSDEIDVRSDVYALGVILYEILAGRLPYDLRDQSLAEAESLIRTQEPTRLSSIDSVFRGDIQTIVTKALAKEKERRYQSALQFGDDIRRYLRDEPIQARPASRVYQIRKFARRNRAIVCGVAAVFVTLVLGIVGISVALVRATHLEQLAVQRLEDSRRSAAKATATTSFLQDMLSSVDPANALGREITVRQTLDEAAAKIESGILKDDPDVESDLRSTIGTTYLALGHYAEAEPQLRTALEIRRRLYGDPYPDVATSLNNLALLYNQQGRHGEEESLLREALSIQRRLHGDKHVDVASTMQSLGAALRTQHKYAEAEPFYRDALAMRLELLGHDHLDVAQSMNSLALLLQDKGDYEAAEPLFREALSIRRKLLGDRHPILAGALNNLANLLRARGMPEEAVPLLREALQMRRDLLGSEHPDVAQSLNNLALYLYETEDYSGAEPLYREALAIWRKTLPAGHSDIGNCSIGLGLVLSAKGEYAEAETLLRESLAIRKSTFPEGHWARFGAMSALGAALAGQGKYEEAEQLLIDGYEGLMDQPQVAEERKVQALQRLIDLYNLWGRPEVAARWRVDLHRYGG